MAVAVRIPLQCRSNRSTEDAREDVAEDLLRVEEVHRHPRGSCKAVRPRLLIVRSSVSGVRGSHPHLLPLQGVVLEDAGPPVSATGLAVRSGHSAAVRRHAHLPLAVGR